MKKQKTKYYTKYPLFLSDFKETWIQLKDVRKNVEISNFMNIRPVGAELFHVDGRTDRYDEANSSFSQFWERAPNYNNNSCFVWVFNWVLST